MSNYEYKENIKEEVIEETPSGAGSFIGILLGLAYLLFLPIIFANVVVLFTGSPVTEFENLFISVLGQCIAGILTVVGMFFAVKKIAKNVIKGFNFKSLLKGLAYALLVFIVSILIGLFEQIVLKAGDSNANQDSLNTLLISRPVIGIFFTVLLAPLIEELIFRFFIFGSIKKKKVWLAYVVSGVSFGLIHFISTLSEYLANHDTSVLLGDLKTLPGYIVAGLLFCYVYDKTKKISCSVFAHMAYNLIVTLTLISSFKTSPFIIKDVTTDNGSIKLAYTYNLDTKVEIDEVIIYIYDTEHDEKYYYDTKEYVLEENNNAGEFCLENLDTNTVYYIEFKYHYEQLNLKMELEVVNGEASTYAIPRKK